MAKKQGLKMYVCLPYRVNVAEGATFGNFTFCSTEQPTSDGDVLEIEYDPVTFKPTGMSLVSEERYD